MASLLCICFRMLFIFTGVYLIQRNAVKLQALDFTPTCTALSSEKKHEKIDCALNTTAVFERLRVDTYKWIPLYMSAGLLFLFEISLLCLDFEKISKKNHVKFPSVWRHLCSLVVSGLFLYMLLSYIYSELFKGNGHFYLDSFKGSGPNTAILLCDEGKFPKERVDCHIWMFNSTFKYTVLGGFFIFFVTFTHSLFSILNMLPIKHVSTSKVTKMAHDV